MIREGDEDVTLKYLRKNPRTIAFSHYTDGSSSVSIPWPQWYPAQRLPRVASLFSSAERGWPRCGSNSTGTRTKYTTLFSISTWTGKGLRWCPGRLCEEWGRKVKQIERRKGSTEGSRMCATADQKSAKVFGRAACRFPSDAACTNSRW